MYCGMALTTARTGREEDVIGAALDHAAALKQQPGCVATYVLKEKEGGGVVALSIFESEDAFRRAAVATQPVIAKHHLEDLASGPPTFRVFEVR